MLAGRTASLEELCLELGVQLEDPEVQPTSSETVTVEVPRARQCILLFSDLHQFGCGNPEGQNHDGHHNLRSDNPDRWSTL
eukprot:4635490-Amphidinium_carterae.1